MTQPPPDADILGKDVPTLVGQQFPGQAQDPGVGSVDSQEFARLIFGLGIDKLLSQSGRFALGGNAGQQSAAPIFQPGLDPFGSLVVRADGPGGKGF